MRKLNNPSNWKFFSTLVAVLGLNLAVFLFSHVGLARAQMTASNLRFINLPPSPISGQVPIHFQIIDSMLDSSAQVSLSWPGSSHASQLMQPNISYDVYTYYWDTTAWDDGDYEIVAQVVHNNMFIDSNPESISIQNNTAPPATEPLSLEFIEINTVVNEERNFMVQTNQAAEVTFELWQSDTLLDSQFGAALGGDIYEYYLDNTMYSSGTYKLNAGGFALDQSYDEDFLLIQIHNPNDQTEEPPTNEPPADEPLSGDEEEESGNLVPKISLMPIDSTAGEPIELKAQSNFSAEWVKFRVLGPESGIYSGVSNATYLYSASWPINEFPYGEYIVKVEAAYGGNIYLGSTTLNYLPNEIIDIPDDQETDIPLVLKFVGEYPQPMTGEQRIRVKTGEDIDSVKFIVSGQTEKEYPGILSSSLEYYFDFLTNDFSDGPYNIRAVAMVDGQVVAENILSIRIFNQDSMGDETADNNQEAEISSSGSTTQESDTMEEETALSTEVEITEIVDEVIEELMPECREAGILDHERCRIFVSLDPECQQQGILEPIKCISYLLVDSACRERGIVGLECDRYLRIPLACREANIGSPLECERFIYEQAMPLVCRQAGVSTQSECRQVLLANSFPLVCREVNINSAEACRDFLAIQEKEVNRDEAATPAQVKTTAMLSELHPRCRALGIEDKNKCEFYLNEILVTNECRSLGLVSLEECSEYMFKKHSQAVCAEAGISKIGECKDFLFNKYTNNIECQGGNDWLCQEILRQDHIGDIAIKQNVFKQIREKFKAKAKAFSIKELKEEIDDPEFFIPLVNDNVMVSAVDAKERMVLTHMGELLQVAPLVLVIDTDGDGLGDDVEKRIGSKVDNPDTDGDGYTDGMEVAKGYNPLGTGILDKTRLAPIDIAIISGELLGHPKTEGELNEKYTVDVVNNQLQSGEVTGYLFSGRAAPNRVVSLYVYSDLPVVTTLRTDEHGNWQYEFSNLLSEGEHEIYVALNDNSGKVVAKSRPFNFLIKEARAVSIEDFLVDAPLSSASSSQRMINFYFIFVGGLIFSGLLLFVGVYMITKKRRSASSKNI